MRKEFKSSTEEGSKARTKETEGREGTKKPLAAELPKGGEQSGESGARHLPCPGMVNKSANERSTPDSSELPDVSLKH
jgi:hypothetical protein